MIDAVAVQLTGRGMGAIGVLLLAGEGATEVVGKIARSRRMKAMAVGEVVHGALVRPMAGAEASADGSAETAIDDAVVVRVGAKRYELHVHGGVAVVKAVMEALAAAGAEVIDVREAAARGLLGARIAGEVALALPLARTMTGARLLAGQIDGGLAAFARQWSAWLAGKTENDLWRMQSAAQWVLARSRSLMGLLEPPRVAIVGPPNAGKSTLANALLGRQVSITSAMAGTTRDWVDAQGVLTAVVSSRFSVVSGGATVDVPVVLVDTAGVRETADAIEAESIARTHQQARGADVVVLVLDGSKRAEIGGRELVERYAGGRGGGRAGRVVVAVNKMDLAGAATGGAVWPGAVGISALRGDGLPELMAAVLEVLDLREVAEAEPFAFTPRQRAVLEEVAATGDVTQAGEMMALVEGVGANARG